jgi:hypothetical protein
VTHLFFVSPDDFVVRHTKDIIGLQLTVNGGKRGEVKCGVSGRPLKGSTEKDKVGAPPPFPRFRQNKVEAQVDNFDKNEDADAFMMGKEFAVNAIGVDFIPEKLMERLRNGEKEEVKKRPHRDLEAPIACRLSLNEGECLYSRQAAGCSFKCARKLHRSRQADKPLSKGMNGPAGLLKR